MSSIAPGVFADSGTVLGRFYGQEFDSDVHLFEPSLTDDGQPVIMVRSRWIRNWDFRLPPGAHILVQLFDKPEALYLAHASYMRGGSATIWYTPVDPLVSADGRAEMPELAEVSEELQAEAFHDRLDDLRGS